MNENTHTTTTEIPERTPQEIERFIAAITFAVNWARDHKHAPDYFPEDGTADILAASFLLNPTDQWEAKFYRNQKIAARFYRNPETYRATIAAGMSTPELQKTCLEIFPDIDQEKYFPHIIDTPTPQRITPKPAPRGIKTLVARQRIRRGLKWRLDDRWDELSRIDGKIFLEGCRRAQIPKKEDDFPWAELGVESLSKKVRATHWQVKQSRFHLCELGLWCRIKRGYKDQGSSKYYTFFTPKMADAYFVKHRGKGKHREP